MSLLRLVLCCLILVFGFSGGAQTFIGLSANLGNQLKYTPSSPGLKTPISISGSILLNHQHKLKNNWVLQYGMGLGALAYALRIKSMDTIFYQDVDGFSDYSTLYGSLNVLVGKEISIRKKTVMIGLGAGATRYYSLFDGTAYGIEVPYNNSYKQVFSAEVSGASKKLIAFTKISVQMKLSKVFTVGLEYSYHFNPTLTGFYQFYYTKTPSAGNMSLYQREFNVVLLAKVSKKKPLVNKPLISDPVLGQSKTYLGMEFTVANDLYKIEDTGNSLQTVQLITEQWGINVRKELSTKLFLEMGITSKTYWEGFGIKNSDIQNVGSDAAFNSLLIPVKIGYRIKLSKGLFLVPTPGFTFGVIANQYIASGRGWGTLTFKGTTVGEYYYENNANISRCFILANPSLAIEKEIFDFLLLSIYGGRSYGFNKVNQLDISYTINNSSPATGKAISLGDCWSVGISAKYAISKIWSKR